MKSFYISLFVFSPLIASAQDYYLKGEVKDESGNLLPKVTIIHCRSGYTFSSREDGLFGIVSNEKTDSLVFSLEGYQTQKVLVDAWNFTTITLKRVSTSTNLSGNRRASITRNLEIQVRQQRLQGNESYSALVENQFIDALKYPATTISLSVDKASYSNVRRFINLNSIVPPYAVRIEEMLNYFNFNYTEPEGGKNFKIKTELTSCPWNKNNNLLFLNITSKRLDADGLPPSHLVFLIDVSASMGLPNRLPILKTAFRTLVNNLREKDSVSIVVYGGTVGVVLHPTSGADKQTIINTINRLTPGGFTPGESGLKLAYKIAQDHFIINGNNRIVLATDGDFNVGVSSESELEELILNQQKQGVYLTCLGIGMGNLKDSKIKILAEKGNGNYAYIDNLVEAEKVLVQEFAQMFYTVANDATFSLEFNPEYVKEYRLIGFDNKVSVLKDTLSYIEGSEIGPEYSLMIIIEIIPKESISSKIYGRTQQLVKLEIKYKEPKTEDFQSVVEMPELLVSSLDKADKSFQFAAAVVMFGSILRQSRYVGRATWDGIINLASVSAEPNNMLQQEFIDLVKQAKKVYSKNRKRK